MNIRDAFRIMAMERVIESLLVIMALKVMKISGIDNKNRMIYFIISPNSYYVGLSPYGAKADIHVSPI